MWIGLRPLGALVFAASLAAIGCHAQVPPSSSGASSVRVGVPLSPQLARRIELAIRSRSDISADYNVSFSVPTPSDVPGYSTVVITFSADGKDPKHATFLVSSDGQTLAQLNKFDISQDLADVIPTAGRPARGGPPTAPVTIVGFDDLECPYCAMMNAEIFPAILDRYKNQVRIVYRDFPLEELHPWAKHAAVDANCLGAQSTPGYWNFVDYVHAHASDMAGTEKTLAKANQNLDKIALDEGTKQKLDQPKLVACVLKQDDSAVKASENWAAGDPLRLDSAPVLYVNGEKVEGVVPLVTLYHVIDRALAAAGQTPPPMPPPPAPAAPASAASTPAKPGS